MQPITKLLLPMFLTVSCSTVSNGLYDSYINLNVSKNPESYVYDQMSINYSQQLHFIINDSIDNNKFYNLADATSKKKLVNIDAISFYIKNGKVNRTSGFENNFKLLMPEGIDITKLLKLKSYTTSNYIQFSDPKTRLLDVTFTYSIIKKGNKAFGTKKYDYFLVKENFNVPSIKWKGENYYWVSDNQIIESKQNLFPFTSKFRLFHPKK